MKVTRWSPDTCECVIDYQWDEKLPLEDRVLTLSAVQHKCPAHASLSNEAVYEAVSDYQTGENPRKNRALALIADQALPQGTDSEKSNFGMECLWSFDQNRLLTIEVPDLPAPIITAMQQKVNDELGINKVKIKKTALIESI